MYKKIIIGDIAFISAIFLFSSPAFAKRTTQLTVNIPQNSSVKASTSDIQIKTSNGIITVTGTADANATINFQDQDTFDNYKTTANSNGEFTKNLKFSKKSKSREYDINATLKGQEDSDDVYILAVNSGTSNQSQTSQESSSSSSITSTSSSSSGSSSHSSTQSSSSTSSTKTSSQTYNLSKIKKALKKSPYAMIGNVTVRQNTLLIQTQGVTFNGKIEGKGSVNNLAEMMKVANQHKLPSNGIVFYQKDTYTDSTGHDSKDVSYAFYYTTNTLNNINFKNYPTVVSEKPDNLLTNSDAYMLKPGFNHGKNYLFSDLPVNKAYASDENFMYNITH